MTREINLEFTRRNAVSIPLKFSISKQPYPNLSNYNIYFTAKKNIDDLDNAAVIGPILCPVVNEDLATAVLNISTAELDIECRNYFYDISMFDKATGLIGYIPQKGKLKISYNVITSNPTT